MTSYDKKVNIYNIFDKLIENKTLVWSFASGFVMMIMAYGYVFFNTSFGGDRWNFFGTPFFGTESSGKWFVQFYSLIKYCSYLPWFIGILGMIYLSVSVYITVKMLKIRRKLSVLIIAGLYTVNISTITASLYGIDDFMFALVMAVLSAGVWFLGEPDYEKGIYSLFHKYPLLRVVFGAIFISLSAGVYGSYVSAGPTLVIITAMVMLLDGEPPVRVLKRGIEYIVTFAVGIVVYYGVLRVFLLVRDTKMQDYMSENRLVSGASIGEYISYIKMAYLEPLEYWTGGYPTSVMPHRTVIAIFIMTIVLLVIRFFQKRIIFKDKISIVIMAFLLLVFPLSAGLIYVMAFGTVHYLMIFTYVFFYVGSIKLIETMALEESGRAFSRLIAGFALLLFVFFVYRGVLVCNMVSNALEKSYVTTQSIATRLIERIESCEDSSGSEKVVFVGGVADIEGYWAPSDYGTYWKSKVSGLGNAGTSHAFSYDFVTDGLLYNVMGFYRDMDYYSENDYGEYAKEIRNMPLYPADGSVKKIGDIIIVKFKALD